MLNARQVEMTVTIRKVVCRRERQYGGGGDGCDGEHVACGKCDTTAHVIREAIEAGEGGRGGPMDYETREFSGVCVGGPLDGRMHAATTPSFTAIEPPNFLLAEVLSAAENLPTRAGFVKHGYIHDRISGTPSKDGVTFWRHQSLTSNQAIRMVFRRYAEGRR